MNILVIEDEEKVATFLKHGLEEQGHDVRIARDGAAGQQLALDNEFHIVLLDLILPGIHGVKVCQTIKKEKPFLPILMLTALGTTDDKLAGFESGADDYLVKPFEFKELLARIKALTKRSQASSVVEKANLLSVGDLQLDLDKKVALRGNKVIALTAKEFSLLEYLIKNKGRVMSRIDIAAEVWNLNFDSGTNVVEVYVNILRKKIDRDFPVKLIQTRIGLGYVIQQP
ncbi:response regulator transcription factor [Pseudochryseolinea flava]|uniref:DNA-binding response regulator n=1 Tax=Pseudochryseolinea flava TaxID=2059302 RepID=A0A364Y003_9BACT|nr:response regulator transcription factor [Pseudochryseolinea flava]RAV99988.1 DNA-binding response regulator [Pseudochryseolinea flava]